MSTDLTYFIDDEAWWRTARLLDNIGYHVLMAENREDVVGTFHFHTALAQHNLIAGLHVNVSVKRGHKSTSFSLPAGPMKSQILPALEGGYVVTLSFETADMAMLFNLSHNPEGGAA